MTAVRTPGDAVAWWLGVLGATSASISFVVWASSLTNEGPRRKRRTMASVTPTSDGPIWPILFTAITRIGDTVMAERRGKPHKGIDILAPAGTEVRAVTRCTILRVIDGRKSELDPRRAAGLFVDARGADGHIYRYLHLGSVADGITAGLKVSAGQRLGTVAPAGTSGVFHSAAHLHFEVRASDWDPHRGERGDYGEPIEPLSLLPRRVSRSRRA